MKEYKLTSSIFKICIAVILLSVVACQKTNTICDLEANFKNPPKTAKPKTWMHAMSGNMSQAGLTTDIEAMAEVGIGGLLLFNIAQGIPYGPINYNTDEHHAMIQHAAKECERLGLTFGVHNCDGWSSSGGPWITPEQSMKMVVWSETIVNGGSNVEVQLEQPTTREGFYRDIAVIAYPTLKSELADDTTKPIITANDKQYNTSLSANYKIDEYSKIKPDGKNKPWIQYDYGKPFTIRSSYLVCNDRNGDVILQKSDDGKSFIDVKKLSKARTGKGEWVHFDQYEPITARYFRLLMTNEMTLKEARLMATYSIDNNFGRTGMARTNDSSLKSIGDPEPSMIIHKESIIDLSNDLASNGILKSSLPAGKWTIQRFGYTSTGAFNHPASDAGRGLECDKLNREAFKTHYDAFVARVISETGKLAPKALQYIEIDSYEMGGQNWTNNFINIFKEAKGYDLTQFLPLFSGKFVESKESSDAVCWDLRQVLSNLMTENYFGYFAELCKRDGLKSYIEPYGNGPVNNLDVGGKSDINMGEFWMNRPMTMVQSAISASHIYGKKVISAESFTSTPEINWKGNPAMAKTSGDLAWCFGINEFMFHRFAHQANTHVKPGMTMNRWGFHFDRTQTWWYNAGKDWFTYIARGSYMLRQGNPVSDLLVFIGDGAPNSVYKRNDFHPAIPYGLKFDNTNADVLINRISTKNSQMYLPEGTTYKMLVLQNCDQLSMESLKRIHEIAQAGVPIIGSKPIKLAGYISNIEDQNTFNKLVSEIWSKSTTYTNFDWNEIFIKESLTPDFQLANSDNFEFIHRKTNDADIYFIFNSDTIDHQFECSFRITDKIPERWDAMSGKTKKIGSFIHENGNTKVWINLKREESAFIVFRESSKGIQSAIKPQEKPFAVEYSLDSNNKLVLNSLENGFITTKLNNGKIINTNIENIPTSLQIEGEWTIQFRKEDNYEASHTFKELSDWKDNSIDEIKYYSGTAKYQKSFTIRDAFIQTNNNYILDLGDVYIVADVKLNGQHIAVDWMPPFQLDITNFIKKGTNNLEIEITNQWSNRLIGDETFPKQDNNYGLSGNPPESDSRMPEWYINNAPMPKGPRSTFCTGQFYKKGDELMPSGLVGPVQIIAERKIKIN